MPGIIDEIKDRLDIVDVVRESITLTPGSRGVWTGTVGVKGNSGKSLHVDRDSQLYYDFKNGRGGDVLNWIADINNLDIHRDIKEVLTIAADKAGIELKRFHGNIEHAQEQRAIHDLYTKAADIYHGQLTDDLYHIIYDKWGITRETVDALKIGFAPTGKMGKNCNSNFLINRFIGKEERETLIKSGLVLKFDNGAIDFFNGRVVFPYWKNGKVVYFIARAVDGMTPKTTYEYYLDKDGNPEKPIKYKKLLTPGEKHPYISTTAGNNYFYGEDSIRGRKECIITEGVTDCITAIQAGFACISPVTVRFRDEDVQRLPETLRYMETVYICNDSEENNAGLDGAIKTAEYLDSNGLNVKMVLLDRGELDKIDIAEYFKNHTAEDFKHLLDDAIPIYEFKLKSIAPARGEVDRIRQAKQFCIDSLLHLEQTERNAFIKSAVKAHFSLSADDIKGIQKHTQERIEQRLKEIRETGRETTEKEEGEEEREQLDEIDISEEDKAKAKNEALEVLKSGNPMKYICETVADIHIGDNRAVEGLTLAIASQSCLNTQGLQIKMSGESGGGKSHLCKSVTHCLRDKHLIDSSLSAKAAYYMKIEAGTILFSDDTEISEDMETVIKRATTNYQDVTTHTTVKDGNSMTLTIPPRILWLITSVEDNVSDQLLNRQLIYNVDESAEQKKKIFEMQKREALEGEIKTLHVNHRVMVCREMWDIIKSKLFKVRLPYADDIDTVDKSNSRNFPMFIDMVRAYAVLNFMQRETNEEGYLLATTDDFYAAKSLFESQTDGILSKLNDKERKIVAAIGQTKSMGATINMIAAFTGYSYDTVRNAIKGRANKPGGLLEKYKPLRFMEETESESTKDDNGTTTTTKKQDRFILDGANVWDIFDNGFVFLKSDKKRA